MSALSVRPRSDRAPAANHQLQPTREPHPVKWKPLLSAQHTRGSYGSIYLVTWHGAQRRRRETPCCISASALARLGSSLGGEGNSR